MQTALQNPATSKSPFTRLGIPERPVLLAPLAGVSDHPFRRICTRAGADLTYVEMLSATALCFGSERTLQMARRHPSEQILGVQLTGKSADETARAIEILNRHHFETIDINMGCPVAKVVRAGCGSAILKDPERVYETVKLARQATDKPLSVKIRLGWDRQSITHLAVAQAAEAAGAAWVTVHGRLRCDDYAVPVDLVRMAEVKRAISIPVIGNGNVFSRSDAERMRAATGVDGVMVSRGALGNPWVFREIKGDARAVSLEEWSDAVLSHLLWQERQYGGQGYGAVCMRKHLLWYMKGWPGAKRLREQLSQVEVVGDAHALITDFVAALRAQGVSERLAVAPEGEHRFVWDPKFDMDRRLDRGVGDEGMVVE